MRPMAIISLIEWKNALNYSPPSSLSFEWHDFSESVVDMRIFLVTVSHQLWQDNNDACYYYYHDIYWGAQGPISLVVVQLK